MWIWILLIVFFLGMAFLIYLKNLGYFGSVEVEEVDIVNMNLVYIEYVGNYKNIPAIFK